MAHEPHSFHRVGPSVDGTGSSQADQRADEHLFTSLGLAQRWVCQIIARPGRRIAGPWRGRRPRNPMRGCRHG
jgi:hypothetical protein